MLIRYYNPHTYRHELEIVHDSLTKERAIELFKALPGIKQISVFKEHEVIQRPTKKPRKNKYYTSTLNAVIPALRKGVPLREEQIDEIERLLSALRAKGWSGLLPADQVVKGK